MSDILAEYFAKICIEDMRLQKQGYSSCFGDADNGQEDEEE